MNKAKRLSHNRLTTGMAMTTAPSTGSDGCDISAWATLYGDRGPDTFLLHVTGSQAATITGATLWLYFADRTTWEDCGLLGDNGDGTIAIVGASQGHSELLFDLAEAQRMAVVGTPSAGSMTASCEPVEKE